MFLVVSRCPQYFLRPHSAGSASSGSGRPVRQYRLRLGVSPQTLQTPPHDGRPVLRRQSARHNNPQQQPSHPPPNSAQRGITPAFGYGPRLGPVRLDFHQQALCAARRTLRRLRPIPDRSAIDAPSPTRPAGHGRQGETRDSSRVRCDSLVEVGARLCPCGLAASTPQFFLAASLAAHAYRLRSSPPTHSAVARRSRPRSTRFRAGVA